MTTSATDQRPRPGRASKLAALVVALCCVCIAGIAVKVSDALDSNAIQTVHLHQQARINGGTLRATQLTAGSKLDAGLGKKVTTHGLFLAVTVELTAPGEKQSLNPDGLHAGTWKYQPVETSSVQAPAGFQTTSRLVFEVNPGHLEGLYLQLSELETISNYKQILRVKLGADQTKVRRLERAGKNRTLKVPSSPTISSKALP